MTVNITIPAGITISSITPTTAALDLRGFASGSTINLINNGLIHGAGGDGGDGATYLDQGAGLASGEQTGGADGLTGGVAIIGPGSGITLNVYNANGRIWGGGGGGGGGGNTAAVGIQNGGGGGGGAGGGRGGRGGRAANTDHATDGGGGSVGRAGVGGVGGAGAENSGVGGAGGDGGTFGVAGTAGALSNAGAAGAAGKAIEFNGGSASVISGAGAPNILGAVS